MPEPRIGTRQEWKGPSTAERLLPWKTIAGCGVAVALALLALGVAFAPEDVPGFTIPGSHQGEATMDSMQMP